MSEKEDFSPNSFINYDAVVENGIKEIENQLELVKDNLKEKYNKERLDFLPCTHFLILLNQLHTVETLEKILNHFRNLGWGIVIFKHENYFEDYHIMLGFKF